jgi:hypothetical protein
MPDAIGARVVLVCLVLSLAGCVHPRELAEARSDAARWAALERSNADRARSLAFGLPSGDPRVPELLALADAAEARARSAVTLGARLAPAGGVAGDHPGSGDPLSDGARVISGFLPAPAGAAVLMGAGLVASIVRARQFKASAASIADGIERAKQADERFRDAFSAVKDTVRASQTKTAEGIVRSVRRAGGTKGV